MQSPSQIYIWHMASGRQAKSNRVCRLMGNRLQKWRVQVVQAGTGGREGGGRHSRKRFPKTPSRHSIHFRFACRGVKSPSPVRAETCPG